MSFGFPYLFKSGIRKKREFGSQHSQLPHHPPPPSQLPSGIQQQQHSHSNKTSSSSSSSDRDHYPTLVSMIQAKTAASSSPNPSPSSSSTSSRSRPTSIAVPMEPEELDDNRCYRYIRSHFNLIFTRSAVVCIPHSRSVDGMILTKDFVGTLVTHESPPHPIYGKPCRISQKHIRTTPRLITEVNIRLLTEKSSLSSIQSLALYQVQTPYSSMHYKLYSLGIINRFQGAENITYPSRGMGLHWKKENPCSHD